MSNADPAAEWQYRPVKDVALCLGIDQRTVQIFVKKLEKDGLKCRIAQGVYDLPVVMRAWLRKQKEELTISYDVDGEELNPQQEKALLDRSKRIAQELRNAKEQKELLDKTLVTQALESVQLVYNNNIDALEGRLTGELVAATGTDAGTILSVLKPELNQARTTTANALVDLANYFASSDHCHASAPDSPMAMGRTTQDTSP